MHDTYCFLGNWLPRIYPLTFARTLASKVEQLKRSANGQPEVPAGVPPALETFCREWTSPDVWHFCDLKSLYEYLRKHKNLQIPQEWKPFVPDRLI